MLDGLSLSWVRSFDKCFAKKSNHFADTVFIRNKIGIETLGCLLTQIVENSQTIELHGIGPKGLDQENHHDAIFLRNHSFNVLFPVFFFFLPIDTSFILVFLVLG